MNFGAELAAGLAELRIHAESKMRATCIIERKSGEATTDDDGVVTAPWVTVYPASDWSEDHPHADGKCEVTDFSSQPTDRDSSGTTIVTTAPSLRLPVDAPPIEVGDRVTITADMDNPGLIGSKMRVAGVRLKGLEKSRRLTLTDYQSGGV